MSVIKINAIDVPAERGDEMATRFAARAGAFDAHLDFAHTMGHGLAGRILGYLLSGIGGAFAGAFETNATGTGPADDVALHVGDAHESIVESGENIRDATADVLSALGFDDLLASHIVGQQLGGSGSGDFGGGDFGGGDGGGGDF